MRPSTDSSRPTVGLIDLRQLTVFPERIDLHAIAKLPPSDRRYHSVHPPDNLVVIVPAQRAELVRRHRTWLAAARSVLWVRDFEGERYDSDLTKVLEAEWDAVDEQLGNVQGRFDINPGANGVLQVALDRALDLAIDPRGRAALGPTQEPLAEHEWPSGPWIRVGCANEGPWVRPERQIEPNQLAPLVCVTASGPALLADGQLYDLATWIHPEPLLLSTLPAAASPDGALSLSREGLLSGGQCVCEPISPFGWPVGFDPLLPLAFAGYRTLFTWYFLAGEAICALCSSSHRWPCGHAKKLWGYKNNQPVTVAVSPDADVYVSTFEHDAMISSHVPMQWRVIGDLAVADWPPPDDPPRALLFCAGDVPTATPFDADDEDQRASAPAVVLGPDTSCRYAVALHEPTYRICEEHAVRIDDSSGGYGVYREDHTLARRGVGRLLGGWFRFATILHDGMLWREDLSTGERRSLGPADREILWAIAVPGTRNVVVVSTDAVRLV